MNKKNVLIFPCGSEIGLEINKALANDIHFEMYGASSLADHGKFVYKNYIEGIPFVDDENFICKIKEVCTKFNIDFIIPAHDSVVLKLAQHKDEFGKVEIITSLIETCEIARSKKKTYEALKDIIITPKVYDIKNSNIDFPVFIKPDVGQGSKGAKKINNQKELENAYDENNDIIISELLPGEEYTIDCFTNSKGKLLFAKGRIRKRINNGIAVNTTPVDNPEFEKIAQKINSKLKFRGMWFFQLKRNNDDRLSLLEIAPRIAGTMGLYRRLGVNFVLLALYDAMGYEVEIIENKFNLEIDRALYTSCKHNIDYKTVYIDFDDTIINQNGVNTDVIKFLYQAKNENKEIVLITKHEKDVKETLGQYLLNEKLFDKIIHIDKSQEKYAFMDKNNSIFIDDSYIERKKVLDNLSVPVFGIDAIDTLFDEKK
ncbi:MAG: ATP-grasp domain-containing protein [Candidatus Gastranaerophilales bacterium]|nr:ATP-grasp domain-containing protein [Candidatus Gastranaerophilales bacterium]